ncbi:MAG TPA: alginate export family protein [Solimonas sp.]|nr:alginate export family protein [Solimonas sp.]
MKTRSGRSQPSFSRNTLSLAIAAAFGLATPLAAHAVDADWRLKATLAGVADGGRDLDLQDADDSLEGYVDTTPWLHLQFSPEWAAFVRVRAYAPSGSVLQSGDDDNGESASKKAFVGLKEAWFEYGGLTSYPGEALRIGRQRIRNDDAQFFDEDIDAVRWLFNTTLVDADLGVARQFDTYRSDDSEVPADQDQRTYGFASLAWDWAARQQIGFRVVYADDDNPLPSLGEPVDAHERTSNGQRTWINAHLDNHPYDWQQLQPVSYWISGTYLAGNGTRLDTTPGIDPVSGETTGEVVAARDHGDLKAWAGEAGLRVHVGGPVQAGIAYAYSDGDEDGDHQYEQTGVHSNYSRFTGTRTQIYRFNDAYRPELGNLQAATAFVSANAGAWDASLIYNKLRRPDADAPVVSDSLRVSPTVDAHDLGQGVDLVLTRYFNLGGAGAATAYTPDDTGDSSIRVRGSWFDPGHAYGDDAKGDYRVVLEFTLWY